MNLFTEKEKYFLSWNDNIFCEVLSEKVVIFFAIIQFRWRIKEIA